jgi:hypothetical protein
VTIVLTMPPGSGLEEVEARVRGCLRARDIVSLRRRDFMVDDPVERDQLVASTDAAVILVGPTATAAFVAAVYAAGLEEAGLPVVLVTPSSVRVTVDHAARRAGAPLRIVEEAEDVVAALSAPLGDDERVTGEISPPAHPDIACAGSLDDVLDHFGAEGWTDGLPIVPPTPAALEAMLAGTSRAPTEVVTETLRPEGMPARVREVAIAAVMAGAAPAQLPIILAAAQVLGGIEFESMTRSVNSFAFAYLVNGPIVEAAGLSGGLGALGPGHQANAVVGRAVGLLTRTVGGLRLGVTSAPTLGNPAAWAFSFAENEHLSPWTPFHTSGGFAAADSAVSVFSGGWSHLGNFYYGTVDDLVRAVATLDGLQGVLVLVSARRAAQLHAAGFTREALEDHLERHATVRLGDLRGGPFFPLMRSLIERGGPLAWPVSYLTDPDDTIVPRFPRGGVRVAVVGGDGTATMQVWALTRHATVSVDAWR